MPPVLLHSVHVLLLAAATVVVTALLVPGLRPARAAARLRGAVAHGELIALAEARARATLTGSATVARPRPALLAFVAATLLAAVVHAGVCPEHFEEGLRFGLFFLVVTVVQLALAVAAARGRSAAVALPAILVNAGCVGLWLLTRTVGLPFGLAEVEPVGLWDVLCSAAEVGAVVAAVRLRPRTAFALVVPHSRTLDPGTQPCGG